MVSISGVHEIEERVLTIFRESLGCDTVGVDDDFITCGGDSMASVRVLARCREAFGVTLGPTSVFESPTARTLARAIAQVRNGGVSPHDVMVPLTQHGLGLPVFFIHAQSGDPRVFQPLIDAAHFVRPIYGPRAPDLDWEREVLDISAMATHYAAAVRRVQRRGPYSLVGYSLGVAVAFEVACRLEADGQEVRHLVLLDGTLNPARRRRAQLRFARLELLRRFIHAGLIGRGLVHRLGFRTARAQLHLAVGNGRLTRRELMTFLTLSAPSDSAARGLRAKTFHELCELAGQQLRGPRSTQAWSTFVRRAGSEDAVAVIKALKVHVKNGWLARLYRPRSMFDGKIVLYTTAGNTSAGRWQRHARQRIEIRRIETVRVGRHGHHASFWIPQNARLYAADLRALLEESAPGDERHHA